MATRLYVMTYKYIRARGRPFMRYRRFHRKVIFSFFFFSRSRRRRRSNSSSSSSSGGRRNKTGDIPIDIV